MRHVVPLEHVSFSVQQTALHLRHLAPLPAEAPAARHRGPGAAGAVGLRQHPAALPRAELRR